MFSHREVVGVGANDAAAPGGKITVVKKKEENIRVQQVLNC
jgi:hypothetical protein